MKILYDYQVFNFQVYGGISRYFYELMNCFMECPEIDFELALRYSNNEYLRNAHFLKTESFFNNKKFVGRTTLLNYINRTYSRQCIKAKNYNIFHPTFYDSYFLDYVGNKPFVVTVYDMIHELFPEMFAPDNRVSEWKKHVIQKASTVIAISENTKRDIIRVYGLNDTKIKVIHLASSMSSADAPSEDMSLPGKFLLYVGQRTGYKNFRFFIEALVPLLKDDADLTIICAGGGLFTPEEESLFTSLSLTGRIRQWQVSDQTMAFLYKNAVAFVFPSLYEGFGIPVLEAFNCNCPAILSNASSLPEVAGDAALYFDPQDKASLCAAVEKIAYDMGYRKELQEKGFQRARDFSWDKTARETKSVYERLL